MPVAGKVYFRVARANNSLSRQGSWLHCCSWSLLQLACPAYRLSAHSFHAFRLQTDRQTDGQTSQLGYILRLWPLQSVDTKINRANKMLHSAASRKCLPANLT